MVKYIEQPTSLRIDVAANANGVTRDRYSVLPHFTLVGFGAYDMSTVNATNLTMTLTEIATGRKIVPQVDLVTLFSNAEQRYISMAALGLNGYTIADKQGFWLDIQHDTVAAYQLLIFGNVVIQAK